MKSISQGTVSSRIRSAMKKTAPLRTPDQQQVAPGVVGGDLGAQLGDARLQRRPRRSGPPRRLARARPGSLVVPPRGHGVLVARGVRDPGHGHDLVAAHDERPCRLAAPRGTLASTSSPAPSCGALRAGRPAASARTSSPRSARGELSTGPRSTRTARARACRTRARRGRRRRGRPPSSLRGSRAESELRLELPGQVRALRGEPRAGSARAPGWSALEQRQDLGADEAAHGVGVRRVGPELEPLGAAVGLGLLAPERQQRTDDAVLAVRLDPLRRAAGDEPVEDGLDLVGGGVARRAQAAARRERVAQVAQLDLRRARAARRSPRRRAPRRRSGASASDSSPRRPWFTWTAETR